MKTIIKKLVLPSTYQELHSAFHSFKKAGRKFWYDLTARPKLRRFRGQTGWLLNIGCGPLTYPGWVRWRLNSTSTGRTGGGPTRVCM